ncbi:MULTISPECIES: hypothetical protein [unclassified Nitratiruptor]|uniref:hypothetical protein n=1 Tax=unclassified Nitratiruptor TaxID=2624044 RepID=UPI001915052A|nr:MULTISPECIES: hypothetical protein [unclassified Nitratiruptor]BCD60581.1 hypothetical protein NitYY0810_C1352 [Nitratiruptor sp. YY08-10]BCD64512.1 hypothetical protein NitYY0814_C1359 [Nitratiruptor sp. YY08-14]
MDANLTRLKTDKEFLENLEKERQKALKEHDIVKLYDVLDTMLALDMEDEKIDELYQEILRTAFDDLAQMLSVGERFDFTKEHDVYNARAIYEHALERWDSKDYKGANELFLVLSYIMPDKYQKAMLLPLGLTAQKESLDRFITEFVDQARVDEESFFFDAFTKNAEEFLARHSDLIEEELKKIEKLAQR